MSENIGCFGCCGPRPRPRSNGAENSVSTRKARPRRRSDEMIRRRNERNGERLVRKNERISSGPDATVRLNRCLPKAHDSVDK